MDNNDNNDNSDHEPAPQQDPFYDDPLLTAETLPVPALIRACRHFANLSQRELAAKVGVSKSYIGDLETGDVAAPSYPLVQRIVEVSGLRLVPITAFAMPLPRRPFDHERDRADRRLPAHLDVRPVLNDADWWFSRTRPGQRDRPQFTASWERNVGRRRRRRPVAARRAEVQARRSFAEARRADADGCATGGRNTPDGSAVSGGDDQAG